MSKEKKYPNRVQCSFSDDEFVNIQKMSDERGLPLATTIRLIIKRFFSKGKK